MQLAIAQRILHIVRELATALAEDLTQDPNQWHVSLVVREGESAVILWRTRSIAFDDWEKALSDRLYERQSLVILEETLRNYLPRIRASYNEHDLDTVILGPCLVLGKEKTLEQLVQLAMEANRIPDEVKKILDSE